MSENPKPRFKSAVGTDFGAYAEYGIQIAEANLAEAKRHHAEVERLLTEIRDRCGPKAWGPVFPEISLTNSNVSNP